ncbi:MAG: DUF1552 domain-containing protein [Myxococcales bacterium]|nr:DUF1552 domain-containing protein [Myxococcales bacterium]
MKRRDVLRGGAAALFALPFLRGARAHAPGAYAKRLIILYHPDGVPGPSSNGDPSAWHPTGNDTQFTLPPALASLAPYRDRCVFFRGLSMGATDVGSHPGGAKKLLTGVDGGNGISIDQRLAQTVGAGDPFRSLYLGAMANQNGASGDKHISYVAPGVTGTPDDDPVDAFTRVFGGGGTTTGGGSDPKRLRRLSALDRAKAELDALRGGLGGSERSKLDLHLEAVREVEQRIMATGGGTGGASCQAPAIDATGLTSATLYAPERFPQILRAQIDLMVQAMACQLTRVGVIQSSIHTSELIMSRFPGTPMYDPGFDMRSHQASHYGAGHDTAHREYAAFVQQSTWWMEQLAYLLGQLAARPEDGGTMLDHSLVLSCTEVCDGNTHGHDDMPFILAGGGSGRIRTGRLLQLGYRRHADLLLSIANAMGDGLTSFGDASSGGVPGLLA